MSHAKPQSTPADWPELPLSAWADTCATLQLWTQIVGKIRLAHAPMVNHWWQVALYLTARGLTTSPIPHGARYFQIDFDFIDHRLLIQTSDGAVANTACLGFGLQRVAMALFQEHGFDPTTWPNAVREILWPA